MTESKTCSTCGRPTIKRFLRTIESWRDEEQRQMAAGDHDARTRYELLCRVLDAATYDINPTWAEGASVTLVEDEP